MGPYGEDLASLLRREGALQISALIDLVLPVVAAVGAAHAEGIVHRDLKPQNIFITRSRLGVVCPKLLDFGIAKVAESAGGGDLTRTSALLGSPYYMSPEQVQGAKDVDGATDQYSLGVILYQGTCARLPFDVEGVYPLLNAIVAGIFVPPSACRPDLPPELEAVIVRAMARRRELRFESASALGAALLPFAGARARSQWEPEFLGLEATLRLRAGAVAMPKGAAGTHGSFIAAPSRRARAMGVLTRLGPAFLRIDRHRLAISATVLTLAMVASAKIVTTRRDEPASESAAGGTRAAPSSEAHIEAVAASPPGAPPAEDTRDPAPPPVVSAPSARPAADKRSADGVVKAPERAHERDDARLRALERPVEPGAGKLNVSATGGWCDVSIDGAPKGPTPIAGVELPAGVHVVTCAVEGAVAPQTANVTVTAASTTRQRFVIAR